MKSSTSRSIKNIIRTLSDRIRPLNPADALLILHLRELFDQVEAEAYDEGEEYGYSQGWNAYKDQD
jgi:hypothetical protein